MPPLTTPATAVLFMIMFFAVMMGFPLLLLRLAHHRLPHFVEVMRTPQRRIRLILPE